MLKTKIANKFKVTQKIISYIINVEYIDIFKNDFMTFIVSH